MKSIFITLFVFIISTYTFAQVSKPDGKSAGKELGDGVKELGKGGKKAGKSIGKEGKKAGKNIGRTTRKMNRDAKKSETPSSK